jgi:hypothetical protein
VLHGGDRNPPVELRMSGSGDLPWPIVRAKAGHEPARAGLGASRSLARSKLARLGLARLSHEPENEARLELASGSVQLELAREQSIRNNEQVY